MLKRKNLSWIASVCLFLGAAPLLAQEEHKTIHIQVGNWEVPREKWDAFAAYYEKYELPVLQKLLAEGVILEYGMDTNALHEVGGFTHTTWTAAHSRAGNEKVLEVYYQSLGADAARLEAEFASMVKSHWDRTYYSEAGNGRPAKMTKGYFEFSSVQVKPGKAREFIRAWKDTQEPIFEQLLKDGVIVAYGLDRPYHHTTESSLGQMSTWWVVADLEASDKMDAAFDAAGAKLSESARAATRVHYSELTVEGSHRDGMTRLVQYQRK